MSPRHCYGGRDAGGRGHPGPPWGGLPLKASQAPDRRPLRWTWQPLTTHGPPDPPPPFPGGTSPGETPPYITPARQRPPASRAGVLWLLRNTEERSSGIRQSAQGAWGGKQDVVSPPGLVPSWACRALPRPVPATGGHPGPHGATAHDLLASHEAHSPPGECGGERAELRGAWPLLCMEGMPSPERVQQRALALLGAWARPPKASLPPSLPSSCPSQGPDLLT